MIKSMTGFGRGKYENEGRIYTVEIKSVNSKYSDINVRLPRLINSTEEMIRRTVSNNISRGKVDVLINFEDYSSKSTKIKINKELAKDYIKELKDLAEEAGIGFDINVVELTKFPEILKLVDEDETELISNELMIALNEALSNFVKMRAIEGQKLIEDIEERIKKIQVKIDEITNYSATLVEEYIEKLRNRVNELLEPDKVNEDRLMQEIVIFSDKSSIEEELTRLKSHMIQFLDLIKKESPIGKKLDFLVQEINREVNTIGSKANCIDITNRVIEIKTEVENIREQIQNIE